MDKETTVEIAYALSKIQKRNVLTYLEAKNLFSTILNDNSRTADFYWGAVFAAVKTRGVAETEISGFIDAIKKYDDCWRDFSDKPQLLSEKPIVAITGSGKDTWKTFNISTAASIVAASSKKVAIIKPGSSAVSAVSGAMQILPCLNVHCARSIKETQVLLNKTNMAILDFHDSLPKYAKRYKGLFFHFHPLSYVLPVLAIPYKTNGVVYGISDDNVELSLNLIKKYSNQLAVCVSTKKEDFAVTDEYLPFGNSVLGLCSENVFYIKKTFRPIPEEIDLISQSDSHTGNAKKLIQALSGNTNSILSQAVAMTAATIFLAANITNDLDEAYCIAINHIESGAALKQLEKYSRTSQKVVKNAKQ